MVVVVVVIYLMTFSDMQTFLREVPKTLSAEISQDISSESSKILKYVVRKVPRYLFGKLQNPYSEIAKIVLQKAPEASQILPATRS